MRDELSTAVTKLMEELYTHFEGTGKIEEDPALFLAYDRVSVLMGDESDEDGVAIARKAMEGKR